MSFSQARKLQVPVTVVLERRIITRSFWSLPSWYLHTVAVGDGVVVDADERGAKPAGATDHGDLFAWSGYQVTLYKDACERYWHALIGVKPLIYVICRDETDEVDGPNATAVAVTPVLVTIDYDEASACAETDSLVLSAAIPAELYRHMEAFVLQHYKPQPFKKRKRKNWSEEPSSRPPPSDKRG